MAGIAICYTNSWRKRPSCRSRGEAKADVGEKENEEQESASAALSKHLTFRIDGELARDLAARVAAEGIEGRRLSRFYRALLRAGLAGGWLDGADKTLTELKALRGELSRIGGNLNQVAHWLNSRDELKDKELLEVVKELRPAINTCAELERGLYSGIIRRTR